LLYRDARSYWKNAFWISTPVPAVGPHILPDGFWKSKTGSEFGPKANRPDLGIGFRFLFQSMFVRSFWHAFSFSTTENSSGSTSSCAAGAPGWTMLHDTSIGRCRASIAVMRWRRMIGIDPHPFALISKRKRHHTRYHRIVSRILLEEWTLLGHLQTVTHDLERRARLRGMLPK